MKKTKTSAAITIPSTYKQPKNYEYDHQLQNLQRQSVKGDHQTLIRKYQLLKQQNQLLKDNKKSMNSELSALKKVLFQNSDIHEVLELQHQKIFDLQTQLQILQNKYNRLLCVNGSSQQTQLAIKYKQMERRLVDRQIQQQKQISGLKSRMMKMNANELYSSKSSNLDVGLNQSFGSTRLSTLSANNNTTISPIRHNKKLV